MKTWLCSWHLYWKAILNAVWSMLQFVSFNAWDKKTCCFSAIIRSCLYLVDGNSLDPLPGDVKVSTWSVIQHWYSSVSCKPIKSRVETQLHLWRIRWISERNATFMTPKSLIRISPITYNLRKRQTILAKKDLRLLILSGNGAVRKYWTECSFVDIAMWPDICSTNLARWNCLFNTTILFVWVNVTDEIGHGEIGPTWSKLQRTDHDLLYFQFQIQFQCKETPDFNSFDLQLWIHACHLHYMTLVLFYSHHFPRGKCICNCKIGSQRSLWRLDLNLNSSFGGQRIPTECCLLIFVSFVVLEKNNWS